MRLSDFGVAATAVAGGVSTKEAMKGLSFSLAPEMRRATNKEDCFGVAADWCVCFCSLYSCVCVILD